MDFHDFWRYVFSSLRNETNVILYYYLIPCRLSTDPEMYDIEWLNGLNRHFMLYSFSLSWSAFWVIICYLFTVEYVYMCDPWRSVGNGVLNGDPLNIWNPRKNCRSFLDATSLKPWQSIPALWYTISLCLIAFHWLQTRDFEWLLILILRQILFCINLFGALKPGFQNLVVSLR